MPGNNPSNSKRLFSEATETTKPGITRIELEKFDSRKIDLLRNTEAGPVSTRSTTNDLFDKPMKKKILKNYLLLIAIDHYNSPILAKLNNPVRDANALLTVLMERYHFFPDNETAYGFLEDNRYQDVKYKIYNDTKIKCLYNEEATKDKITDTITEIFDSMDEENSNGQNTDDEIGSQFLIYYAGHGDMIGNNYVFPTINYDKRKNATYVSIGDILFNFKTRNKCKNLLLVVDACYAGAAPAGATSNKSEDFSRDILMSCSAKELAVDGRYGQGSPFSIALCEYLRDNSRQQKFKAEALPELIRSRFLKLFQGQKVTQEPTYGKAPADENGLGSFTFELKDQKTPEVKLFAECLINHLDFTTERQYFDRREIVKPDTKNKDYIIISSVSFDSKLEGLRGNIISKSIAKKMQGIAIRNFTLLKPPLNISCDMIGVEKSDDIFVLWGNKKNLTDKSKGGTDTATFSIEDKIDHLINFLGNKLEKSNNQDNPLCVGLILKNFSPDKHSVIISDFIHTLVRGLEKFKRESSNVGKQWDKLVMFIISELEPELYDVKGFSEEKSPMVYESFKKEKLDEPFFKWFDKIGNINFDTIDNWLTETEEDFQASDNYQNLRKEGIDKIFFSKAKELSVGNFLSDLSMKVGYNLEQQTKLFSILLFDTSK